MRIYFLNNVNIIMLMNIILCIDEKDKIGKNIYIKQKVVYNHDTIFEKTIEK